MTFEFPSGPLNLQLLAPPHRRMELKGGIFLYGVQNPRLEGIIEKGDYIVEIAGEPVDGLYMKDVTKRIISLPRPLSVTFVKAASLSLVPSSGAADSQEDRSDAKNNNASTIVFESSAFASSQRPATYTVMFGEGPMGLRLEHKQCRGCPVTVVKDITGQAVERYVWALCSVCVVCVWGVMLPHRVCLNTTKQHHHSNLPLAPLNNFSGKIRKGDAITGVRGERVLGAPYKRVISLLRYSSVKTPFCCLKRTTRRVDSILFDDALVGGVSRRQPSSSCQQKV